MSGSEKSLLLMKYFNQGALRKKYYGVKGYQQYYSAEDRLAAGYMFYYDYRRWKKGQNIIRNYDMPKIDGGKREELWLSSFGGEAFRRAVRHLSRAFLPVLYKIILEETEIKAPKNLGAREKLYFNDEIKTILCRGLDELCAYYHERKHG